MGYMFLFNQHGRLIACTTQNVDERSRRYYLNYYINIDPCRLSTPIQARKMYTDWSRYKNTEFYNDFGKQKHVDFSAGLQFHYPGGSLMGILFLTRAGPHGFSSLDMRVLDLLQPHIENLLFLVTRIELSEALIQNSAHINISLSSLTQREKQIILLICKGMHTKAISSFLMIQPSTVYRHISNIFEKTGVCSREELLALLNGTLAATTRQQL